MRFHALLLWAVLTSQPGHAQASASPVSPYESATRAALSGHPRVDAGHWDLPKWSEPLLQLYASRSFEPLWFAGTRLTDAGRGVLTELLSAERRGLLLTDYDLPGLQQRLRAATGATASDIAQMDVAISVATARLTSDLHMGRIRPSEVGYDLDIRKPAFDVALAVRSLAASANVSATLDSLEPQLRHYALLKIALARYRELAATRSELASLPPLPRARVRPEEDYAGAPALRQLLIVVGDLASAAATTPEESRMDPLLVEALRRFQARHGLDADGVLGRGTFRALTTPFAGRVQQIELSLERMRWLPSFDTPPIIVNIPQFRLFAFRTTHDAADEILQMDVIVGEAFKARRTPVFAADMSYVVLQPYWDVPRSILLKELLPSIRADASWVAKNGYEIVRGDSDGSRVLPATPESVQLLVQGAARLRQKPGPANALGHVKFMFPNRHNVYLHDTPARALFSRSRRAFSHGCIRVSDPTALLAHVMRDDPQWSDTRRDEAMARASPTRVALVRPIRVLILYGTALANEDGRVQFFDDIYAQDAPLIAKLSERHSRSTGARAVL